MGWSRYSELVKIFISWSGRRSKQLAEALKGWLPKVIQSVECFYSDDGIRAGQRWNNEINTELEATDFGILCVTPGNVGSPWLNFEAGALAKRVTSDSRVVPVTLGFEPSKLASPLNQFNGVAADEIGIRKLVKSITDLSPVSVDVDELFDVWWPSLRPLIDGIDRAGGGSSVPRAPTDRELLQEVLGIVQGLAREPRGYSAVLPPGLDPPFVGGGRRHPSGGEEALGMIFEYLSEAVAPGTPRAVREQSLERAEDLGGRLDGRVSREVQPAIAAARQLIKAPSRRDSLTVRARDDDLIAGNEE